MLCSSWPGLAQPQLMHSQAFYSSSHVHINMMNFLEIKYLACVYFAGMVIPIQVYLKVKKSTYLI